MPRRPSPHARTEPQSGACEPSCVPIVSAMNLQCDYTKQRFNGCKTAGQFNRRLVRYVLRCWRSSNHIH
jgi:hypothetical protein